MPHCYGVSNAYARDPVTDVRLRPANIHKLQCGHHITKSTFAKMVAKSPKTFSKEFQHYVLCCPVCRDVIYVCDF
jgi:hypothetical protein